MTKESRFGCRHWPHVVAVLFLPALHPLLMPAIGMPSHLLWWVHVLPVAFLTFWFGRTVALGTLFVSAAMVAVGELMFGLGYGVAAPLETVVALTLALTLTNALVAAFAMYARDVSDRYRVLFQSVGMGVIQLDADKRVAGLNPAAKTLLGVTDVRALLGRPIAEVLSGRGLPTFEELDDRGGWAGEVEVHTPTGVRTLHALLALGWDADRRRAQLLVADRSTEVMQEQEMERQSRLAALGEALAGVAHELNNPLTAILGHAQLGEHENEPAEVAELFNVIEHEAFRMQGIVGELLGFSRRAETAECQDLDSLLSRLARVQRIALGKTIRIDEELAWPKAVHAADLKIEQIVINLISNAAYALRVGNGEAITLSSRSDGEFVEIEVRDDGPGIEPEILGRLFEPFYTTKPEGEGTGLGLAISRRLARGWGGDLTARNVDPRGAAFTLRVRVDAQAGAELPGVEDAAFARDARRGPGRRVDDQVAPNLQVL